MLASTTGVMPTQHRLFYAHLMCLGRDTGDVAIRDAGVVKKKSTTMQYISIQFRHCQRRDSIPLAQGLCWLPAKLQHALPYVS